MVSKKMNALSFLIGVTLLTECIISAFMIPNTFKRKKVWKEERIYPWQQLAKSIPKQAIHVCSKLINENETTVLANGPECMEEKNILEQVDGFLSNIVSEAVPTVTENVLRKLDEEHAHDVNSCTLHHETMISYRKQLVKYERVEEGIIRTTVPILNDTALSIIRSAAEAHRNAAGESTGISRFTYQRTGNSEVHVTDLNDTAVNLVHEVLTASIYPLIRRSFDAPLAGGGDGEVRKSQLSVYDALIIRYDADAAAASSNRTALQQGAGQPLHRDLGVISVNIALNPVKDFHGGGTLFENQMKPLLNTSKDAIPELNPLKPIDAGYAILHPSSYRHAGAATTKGIRDILVIFVTERFIDNALPAQSAPLYRFKHATTPYEMNARLKSAAGSLKLHHSASILNTTTFKALYYRLAINAVPTDGEAWQFLAMALLDLRDADSQLIIPNTNHLLDLVIQMLTIASLLTPCDERIHNNLGLSLQRKYNDPNISKSCRLFLEHRIPTCFRTSIQLSESFQRAGCHVNKDVSFAARLNLGLFYANLDLFEDAVTVLAPIYIDEAIIQKERDDYLFRIVSDGNRLYQFCRKQLMNQR